MRFPGLSFAALLYLVYFFSAAGGISAAATTCSQNARSGYSCELTFEWKAGEISSPSSAYRDEVLSGEFRSPRATTYRLPAFWTGGNALKLRFTPTEPGTWTYRLTSTIKRYEGMEGTFNVADSDAQGVVQVANLRHWRTSNKKPHLWLAAEVPFLEIDPSALASWLDRRKQEGFTHIRGPLLTDKTSIKPLSADGLPNPAYFSALDDAVLAAESRGFALDLIVADDSFLRSGALSDWQKRGPLYRYLLARYGGLNITWQGFEHFEEVADSRALLKDLGSFLKDHDSYQHPRSTDARDSSAPLVNDGWLTYLIEASPDPQLGAVEHQFTTMPEIHVVNATDPERFRHEIWDCTTNGEYPSISFESLKNEANDRAIAVWSHVLAETRHWELEPYFDVDASRAVGLNEVEYLAYAAKPGIVEITLPKHKYNPEWVNPQTGEEIPLKDYRGEVLSRQTPDNSHDWVLNVPREGLMESMSRYYYFESQDPPVQEVEVDPAKAPFAIVDPDGETVNSQIPNPYKIKITRANRASRTMQYVWWGEVVASGQPARLLGLGSSGNFTLPPELRESGGNLNVRLEAINANGKAYELDRVYRLSP